MILDRAIELAIGERASPCNDENCIAPKTVEFDLQVGGGIVDDKETTVQNSGNGVLQDVALTGGVQSKWWQPVKFEGEKQESISETSWWYIFIWGFGGGLLALLTPCVWPLIPMTVSFFLKKTSSRSKAIGDAITYGIAIIVI